MPRFPADYPILPPLTALASRRVAKAVWDTRTLDAERDRRNRILAAELKYAMDTLQTGSTEDRHILGDLLSQVEATLGRSPTPRPILKEARPCPDLNRPVPPPQYPSNPPGRL